MTTADPLIWAFYTLMLDGKEYPHEDIETFYNDVVELHLNKTNCLVVYKDEEKDFDDKMKILNEV